MTDDSVSRSARGVYGIAVTSELSSALGPQTLRLYERRGLLTPSRTDGGTRRYSDDDLERLAADHRTCRPGRESGRHRPHPGSGKPETASWNRTTPSWRSSTPDSRPIKDLRQAATPRQKNDGRIPVTAPSPSRAAAGLPHVRGGRREADSRVPPNARRSPRAPCARHSRSRRPSRRWSARSAPRWTRAAPPSRRSSEVLPTPRSP